MAKSLFDDELLRQVMAMGDQLFIVNQIIAREISRQLEQLRARFHLLDQLILFKSSLPIKHQISGSEGHRELIGFDPISEHLLYIHVSDNLDNLDANQLRIGNRLSELHNEIGIIVLRMLLDTNYTTIRRDAEQINAFGHIYYPHWPYGVSNRNSEYAIQSVVDSFKSDYPAIIP